mgnify:CR=1 FL=1
MRCHVFNAIKRILDGISKGQALGPDKNYVVKVANLIYNCTPQHYWCCTELPCFVHWMKNVRETYYVASSISNWLKNSKLEFSPYFPNLNLGAKIETSYSLFVVGFARNDDVNWDFFERFFSTINVDATNETDNHRHFLHLQKFWRWRVPSKCT